MLADRVRFGSGNIAEEDWIIEEIDGQDYDLGSGNSKMTVEFSVPRDTQIYMEIMDTRPTFQMPVLEDNLVSLIFFRNSDRVIADVIGKGKIEYVLGSKDSKGLYHKVTESTSSSAESEYFESAILIGEYEESDPGKNHISIKTSNIIELTKGDTWRMLLACRMSGALTGYTPTIAIRDVKDDRVLATYSFYLTTCYLTTCMVHYYGKSDDGVELTSMRKLREKYKHKHKEILEQYNKDSRYIIEGIEQSGNQEYWYRMIKDVVDKIVIWVANEEWEKAEVAYLDLYYKLREKFYSEGD